MQWCFSRLIMCWSPTPITSFNREDDLCILCIPHFDACTALSCFSGLNRFKEGIRRVRTCSCMQSVYLLYLWVLHSAVYKNMQAYFVSLMYCQCFYRFCWQAEPDQFIMVCFERYSTKQPVVSDNGWINTCTHLFSPVHGNLVQFELSFKGFSFLDIEGVSLSLFWVRIYPELIALLREWKYIWRTKVLTDRLNLQKHDCFPSLLYRLTSY